MMEPSKEADLCPSCFDPIEGETPEGRKKRWQKYDGLCDDCRESYRKFFQIFENLDAEGGK